MINLESPVWDEYELLDCGNFAKLERFGKYVLSRPEPQAIWSMGLSKSEWDAADAKFIRSEDSKEKGQWKLRKNMPEQWWLKYSIGNKDLKFRLGLTSFKHVGIFPEQASNWNYIFEKIARQQSNLPVLNLFAYTGAASLVARAAGAKVIHLDSVKPVVTWARENMEKSGLDGISWVVEDAAKFVKREVTRGHKYSGIILDPPAYGRGPQGERWILEELLPELLTNCSKLLDQNKSWLVLNLYSMGLSPLVAGSLIESIFRKQPESGELFFADRNKRRLPLGIYSRFST